MRQAHRGGRDTLGQHNKKRDTWAINRVQPRKTDVPLKKLKTVWRHTSHDAGTHGSGLLARSSARAQALQLSQVRVRDPRLPRGGLPVAPGRAHRGLLRRPRNDAARHAAAEPGRRRPPALRRSSRTTRSEERAPSSYEGTACRPGDPEWERHGIFELACRPRCEAAITGKRPDGSPAPGKYLDGAPSAEGFEENCEFYRLEYLHPDNVELGRAFQAIHPLLWLMAGARGKRADDRHPDQPFAVVADSRLRACCSRSGRCASSSPSCNETAGVEHVFLVTDSEDAYAEMARRVGPGYTTHMLYRDYLRSFRIQAVPSAMKLALKDFQDEAVRPALRQPRRSREATGERAPSRRSSCRRRPARARPSWPTRVDGAAPRGRRRRTHPTPSATFLWMTDQPELNEQTRRKMETRLHRS